MPITRAAALLRLTDLYERAVGQAYQLGDDRPIGIYANIDELPPVKGDRTALVALGLAAGGETLTPGQAAALERLWTQTEAVLAQRTKTNSTRVLLAAYRLVPAAYPLIFGQPELADLILEGLGGSTPVQGEGSLSGRPWYFRARGTYWRFSLAHPGEDPVAVGWSEGGVAGAFAESAYACSEADCDHEFCAGWMPLLQSMRRLTAGAEAVLGLPISDPELAREIIVRRFEPAGPDSIVETTA